jgi:hypothetical protein
MPGESQFPSILGRIRAMGNAGVDPREETREKREKQSVATAAYEVLRALRSKAVSAARELGTTLKDDKPAPPRLVREVHDALLSGLMDKRVRSGEIERKKLFGIPLEAEVPARSQMRALVKRFEQAFMSPARTSHSSSPRT